MKGSRFIVGKASAGAGKTFALVKTFIDLAFDVEHENQLNDRFKHILCITFTNKAVNEMKQRIMDELKLMAADVEHSDMARAIVADRASDATDPRKLDLPTVQRYAAKLRSAILHNYSDFSVSTIDSFMHRVVRTFAYDLNLPLKFEVTMRAEDVTQQVVADLMMAVGQAGEEELTRLLNAYCASQMDDDRSFHVEGNIAKLCARLFDEAVFDNVSQLQCMSFIDMQALDRRLRDLCAAAEQEVRAQAKQLLRQCDDEGLEDADFSGGQNGAKAFLRKLVEADAWKPTGKLTQKFLDHSGSLSPKKCPEDKKAAVERLHPAFVELFANRDELLRAYNSCAAVRRNIYVMALANRLCQMIQHYYRDNEVLHLSEFNHRIADVVRNEPMPFIYERLGTRYWNYMIDEFQDTSRLQWQNLLPLVDNGVSANYASLIVGDAKQSIYRFRQAYALQFARLPEVEDESGTGRGANFKHFCHDMPLGVNYRSWSNIVEFNNHFFSWAVQNRLPSRGDVYSVYMGQDYDPQSGRRPSLCQDYRPGREGGYVSVQFVDKDEQQPSVLDKACDAIYEAIAAQRQKGYAYKDMLILARTNKNLARIGQNLAARSLDGQPLPLVSSESFLLANSRAVAALLALLHYVADDDDRMAAGQLVILLSQMGIASRCCVDAFVGGLPVRLEELLRREGLELYVEAMRSMSLYDCCEEGVRRLRLGEAEPNYIASFLDIVESYSRTHPQDLPLFLEWYEQDSQQSKFATKTSEDNDAIRLMTIHKAKGLEAPIVIYPIFKEKEKPSLQWIDLDDTMRSRLGIDKLPVALVELKRNASTVFDDSLRRELEACDMDELNAMYVALTRPREKLFVVCQMPKDDNTDDNLDALPKPVVPERLLYDFGRSGSPLLACDDEGGGYRMGADDDKRDADKASQSSAVVVEQVSYEPWTSKLRIAVGDSDNAFGAREHGVAVHEILSCVTVAADADAAIASYLQAHAVPPEEADALRRSVHEVVAHPECSRFFAADCQVKNECELTYNGDLLRLDRLVIAADTTYVVDYKTGSENLGHFEQVARYCAAVSAMGFPNVSGYIIYVNPAGCRLAEV